MSSLNQLSAAWTAWCRFVGRSDDADADSSPSPAVISERLRRVHPRHRDDAGPVEAVVYTLYRGVPLLLAALSWGSPRAGGSADEPTPTDMLRGDQWRLVMAFGGFEAVARAVLAYADAGGLTSEHFEALVGACALSPYPPLRPPALREPERDRWFQTGLGAREDLVRRLLGLSAADAAAVGRWLAEGHPVGTWPEALQMAQALRNATVHGALSASKVREWKLRPALRRLTDDLGATTAAVLRTLADEPATPAPGKPVARRVRRDKAASRSDS